MANPWKIQILTTDYLVEGIYDNENQTSQEFFQSTAVQNTYSFQLTDVRLQPSGNLTTPSVSVNNWTTSVAKTVVAVIPCDQPSQAFVVDKHKKFKSFIPTDIYVGPYVIHGTVVSPEKPEQGLSFLSYYINFLVKDARIECQLPGAKLQGLEAPFILVRSFMLHGVTMRA